MLVEIKCDHFHDNPLSLRKGLNVILGDEKATNSIGKSNALMVIDFAFGGSSFTDRNKDVMNALGHHSYSFCFEFNMKKHYFRRETYDPKVIYRCNAKYKDIDTIALEDFNKFLGTGYGVNHLSHLRVRAIVGVYSRIWGKDNYDAKKPLHADKNQKESVAILALIKLFDKFSELQQMTEELEKKKEAKQSLSLAKTFDYVPKIDKAEFKGNQVRISSIEKEIEEIKKNLARHACDLSDLVNRDMLGLKEEKDALLELDIDINNRLRRVRNNLSKNSFIRSKNLAHLKEFFPDVNVQKISQIENFHDGLKEILKEELRESERALEGRLDEVQAALKKINKKISTVVDACCFRA
jgi:hypothetical protein